MNTAVQYNSSPEERFYNRQIGGMGMMPAPREFVLDDLSFWVKAFDAFDIDISMLVPDYRDADQVDLLHIEDRLEEELQRDADHQLQEWIINDRAYEAFGLIESDGPDRGLDGRLVPYAYKHENKKENAFINLVKTNVDRVVSQLELANLSINAVAIDKADNQSVQAFNDLKDNILDDNNFEADYQGYIRDGVTFGSGFLHVCYDFMMDNPDLAVLYNRMFSGKPLTQQEYALFKRAIKGHKIEYVPTFEMIRYRGAKGEQGRSIHNPVHRWLHRTRQIPLSEARSRFPEYKDYIYSSLSNIYTDTNPHYYYRHDITDTVTLKESWIRFRLQGDIDVPVQYPEGVGMEGLEVSRFAIAKVTRIEGLGIVDLEIDEYNHNRFPFVNWNYSNSFRHSCGIGIVKYGRDPVIVHNMLHNGMLRYFGTQVKGGGFVDSRLGLTEDQLNQRTEPGKYVPVHIPEELQDKTLKDFVVDNRPPTFPSVYADLMSLEANAVDTAMSVPDVYKGIQSGSSGFQEQILQQQAEMTHSASVSALQQSLSPLGVMMFSNLQQYEKDPMRFFVDDPFSDEQRVVEINMPKGWYLRWDLGRGRYVPDFSRVENDIRTLTYKVKITTKSIVPSKPAQKAAFYDNFYRSTAAQIADPIQREWLKGMNKYGFRLPGVNETIEKIEQKAQQQQSEQIQLAQVQMQGEKEKEAAELGLKKRELDIEQDEVNKDYMVDLLKIMKDMQAQQQQQSEQIQKLISKNTN